MSAGKIKILEFVEANKLVNADLLATTYGMKLATARQYLSSLAKKNVLARVGQGVYSIAKKQAFAYTPSCFVRNVCEALATQLPFTDFCIYDGSIFEPIQHHLSINHSIYVETNRDAVESVFARLKEQHKNVYRQPDATFVYDYIDLKEENIIVKPLVTESPLMNVDGIKVPTLEKLLVDIQKDTDLDYLRGLEAEYMFQLAFDQFAINSQRLMRYANRRGIAQEIDNLAKRST